MGLFNRKELKQIEELRTKLQETEQRGIIDENFNPINGTMTFNSFSQFSNTKSLQLSTVWRCVSLISDSVASTPIYPYYYSGDTWKYIDEKNSLYNLLNVEPNPSMGAFTFKKLMVVNLLLKGNCYILITKDNDGTITRLDIMNSGLVKPYVTDDLELRYIDTFNNKEYDRSQIIHILNYTNGGLIGESTIAYAATTLGIAYDSDQHSANHFKSGGALTGILAPKAGSQIGPDKAAQAKTSFQNANNTDIVGVKTNSVVVMEAGLEYQPISISPAESQLLESRKFNVIDICRFFNVPPSLVFSETGKFSTAEAEQITFLTNTLQPIIEKIENEMFRKLYLPSEWSTSDLRFDVENLMRLDAVTKADVLVKLYGIGVKSTNEGRELYNAKYPVPGGNQHFVPVNLQPIDNLFVNKGNPQPPIDNNLKNNNNA